MTPIVRMSPAELVELYAAEYDAPKPTLMVNRGDWPPGTHSAQPDGRWNFIHSHVGNRKLRRAARAKARSAAWKAAKAR